MFNIFVLDTMGIKGNLVNCVIMHFKADKN